MKKLQEAALRFMDSVVIRKLTQELTTKKTWASVNTGVNANESQ